MQHWTETLPKRLLSGSVHAGNFLMLHLMRYEHVLGLTSLAQIIQLLRILNCLETTIKVAMCYIQWCFMHT